MAGYTRQDTANNISNGSIIDADDFDAEYNAIEGAFNSTTGHTHDGTSGSGAPITVVGPARDVTISALAVLPKTTNTVDVGSADLAFKDATFDGEVTAGSLAVTGTSAFTNSATFGSSVSVTGAVTVGSLNTNSVDINGGNIDNTIIGSSVPNTITGTTVTATTGFVGNVTGDVVGDVTGNLVGDVTGNILGDQIGNMIGNVVGQVSSISNHTTDDLSEGLYSLYYTNSRARGAISVTDAGGDGSLTYNSATGVITYTGPSAAEVRAHFSAGTGIAIASGVISGVDATATTKGVASFNATDFSVTSGSVSLQAERIQDIVGGMLTGNVENGITVTYQDGTAVIDFDVNDPTISLTGDVVGSATMTNLGSVSIAATIQPNSVALGTDTTGNYVGAITAGTGVTLTGSAGEGWNPTISIGQSVATTASPTFANMTLTGNLDVLGTLTTTNTTELTVTSQYITVNDGQVSGTLNGGLEVDRGSDTNVTIEWDEANDRWTVGSYPFVASTFIGALSGNATTATTLQTTRNIGGVPFNGSTNITLPGVDATGNQDTTGNAATATKLKTARTIGGVSFDGSANISLPGVNTTGNQNTTGSAAKWTTARTITLGGDLSGSVSIDGSANVTLNGYVTANNVALGTDTTGNYVAAGATSGNGISGSVSSEGGTFTVTSNATNANTASTIVFRDASGNFSAGTITAALSGNASTATKLATARSIALSGDVSGSATFDGSANVTITATVADDSHNHTIANVDGLQTALNGKLALAGGTMTGNTTFNDNAQLNLGTSSDAELYFNGSALYLDMNSDYDFYIRDGNNTNATRFTFDTSAGTFTASGDIYAFSDERLKTDIVTIPSALDKVCALRGVNYIKDGKASTGLIAQEVQSVIPEVVQQGEEYLSVAYGNLVGVLIEAIKELKEEVETLKKG